MCHGRSCFVTASAASVAVSAASAASAATAAAARHRIGSSVHG